MLKANTLVCDTLKADGRVEARKVCGEKSDGRFDSLSYRLPGVGAGKTLELVRGKGISVFEYGFDLTLNNGRSSMRANPGDCLCKAPADGVATIRCVSNGPTFSIVRFCARGEDIRVPSECPSADTDEGEAEFAVGFHPFKDGASDK